MLCDGFLLHIYTPVLVAPFIYRFTSPPDWHSAWRENPKTNLLFRLNPVDSPAK